MRSTPSIEVLVVEDDEPISTMIVRLLQRAGLATDVAGTVVEAKRLLARGDYTVLVLDLRLGDGTGLEVIDFIKAERLQPIHIVVITAAEHGLIQQVDRRLVHAVLLKPLDIEDFVATVRALAINGSTRLGAQP